MPNQGHPLLSTVSVKEGPQKKSERDSEREKESRVSLVQQPLQEVLTSNKTGGPLRFSGKLLIHRLQGRRAVSIVIRGKHTTGPCSTGSQRCKKKGFCSVFLFGKSKSRNETLTGYRKGRRVDCRHVDCQGSRTDVVKILGTIETIKKEARVGWE